jgi:ABC-type multidrug transport system fused ATPase/permease subunit
LSVEPEYLARFRQSAFGACSSLLLFVALSAEISISWLHGTSLTLINIRLTLTALQLVFALGLTITYCCVPRRPDVHRDGKIVDQQYTTSILGRFSFSWPTSVLGYAAANKGLEIEDLPEIDYQIRSRTLRERFEQVGSKNKLWKSLLWSHKIAFISQSILVTLTSVTKFLPQIALYFILQALEARDGGDKSALGLWIWAFVLGLSIVISSWLEAWLFFVSYSRLGQPIFQQLAAVIFGKATRRKNIKGVSKTTLDATSVDRGIVVDEEPGIKGEDPNKITEGEDDSDAHKTRQSTINLVGVDSYRISSFASYVYIFPGTLIKLALAFGFLIRLIGWIPLLAGLAVPVILTPVNVIISKNYAKAQDDLMRFRDKKIAVVTEALQGIRQIKFSAFEDNWQRKILEVRTKELRTLWRVFKFDNTLIAIWYVHYSFGN